MRTVLAHGCFDVLHIGHIRLLKAARSMGDELVVSLLADEFVTKYKGPERPFHTLDMRIEQLRALRCVDRVVVVDGPGHEAVEQMIEAVRPAVYVKGLETKGKFGEAPLVRRMGIEMAFFDMVELVGGPASTTRLWQLARAW